MILQLLLVGIVVTTGTAQSQFNKGLEGKVWNGKKFGPDPNEQRVTNTSYILDKGKRGQKNFQKRTWPLLSPTTSMPILPIYQKLVEACKTGQARLKKVCDGILGASGSPGSSAIENPPNPGGKGKDPLTRKTVFPQRLTTSSDSPRGLTTSSVFPRGLTTSSGSPQGLTTSPGLGNIGTTTVFPWGPGGPGGTGNIGPTTVFPWGPGRPGPGPDGGFPNGGMTTVYPWGPVGLGPGGGWPNGGMTTVFPWGPGRPGEGRPNGGMTIPSPWGGRPGGPWGPWGPGGGLPNGRITTPSTWGPGGPGGPWGPGGGPWEGSDAYPFGSGKGTIRVRKFSPPYNDDDEEEMVSRLRKKIQDAINDAVRKQLVQENNPLQNYQDFVRVKIKYSPIRCEAVFTESTLSKKKGKYYGDGYKCLAYRKRIVGICAPVCPPANVGKCCNSNKDLYIDNVPKKFTKMMIRAEVLHQPLRWWRKNKWLDVLSKAMKKLREGRYRRAFSKASFDFD